MFRLVPVCPGLFRLGEGFRVGHGEFSSCPVWQGYRGSSAVRFGMVGNGAVRQYEGFLARRGMQRRGLVRSCEGFALGHGSARYSTAGRVLARSSWLG